MAALGKGPCSGLLGDYGLANDDRPQRGNPLYELVQLVEVARDYYELPAEGKSLYRIAKMRDGRLKVVRPQMYRSEA